MAVKRKSPGIVTRKAGATGTINITELVLKQPYRKKVGIDTWRNAILAAESIISPRRQQLLDLYDDLILDGHLRSVIDKRRRAVRSVPITFSKGGEAIDEVNNFLNTKAFRQMLSDLTDHKFYGHSLVQVDFTGEKLTYKLIPRKHVKPDLGIVIINEGDMTGTDYRSAPECNYILEAGDPRDLGLLMPAAQYVIWKRGGFGDWAELAELFGRPLRKGKYNPGDEQGKAALIQLLEQLGGSPFVAYPEGTDVQVDASGSNLTGDIYATLKDACNAEISKLFIGSTLTTEAGNKGARALGEIHERGEQDVFNEDRMDIMSLLNDDFYHLLELHGFPVAGGEFTYQDTEELSRKVQLDMWDVIKNKLGVPIDDNDIYETFDIPRPANYDALKAKAEADAEAAKQRVIVNSPVPGKIPGDITQVPDKIPLSEKPAKGKKIAVVETHGRASLRGGASFKDSFTNFFESLIGKSNPIDAFAAKTQTEARRIAKMIYDDTLPDDFTVDEGMVSLIGEYLVKAIEEGYGSISATVAAGSRKSLGEQLIMNAYRFSAAKTEAMQRDMSAMLVNTDKEPMSFANFRKVADSLNIQYNKNWMQTEWNTATSSGMMAEKWQGYVDDADVMPYLEFITAKDERVRAEHAELDGVIRPVDDPFWDTYYPPLDWNCRCDVVQVTNPDAKPTDITAMSLPTVPDQFANNPGKTGVIFNDANPTMAGASAAALNVGSDLGQQYIDDL